MYVPRESADSGCVGEAKAKEEEDEWDGDRFIVSCT